MWIFLSSNQHRFLNSSLINWKYCFKAECISGIPMQNLVFASIPIQRSSVLLAIGMLKPYGKHSATKLFFNYAKNQSVIRRNWLYKWLSLDNLKNPQTVAVAPAKRAALTYARTSSSLISHHETYTNIQLFALLNGWAIQPY